MTWNAGGWFGGQLGATVWMLVAGISTAVRDLPAGMIVILLFAVASVIGIVLWVSRKLSCYAPTQLLIAIAGVCGLLTVSFLEGKNTLTQMQAGEQVSALSIYWIVGLVFGGLMLIFYLRFGRGASGPEAESKNGLIGGGPANAPPVPSLL